MILNSGLVGEKNLFHPLQDLVVLSRVQVRQPVTTLGRLGHAAIVAAGATVKL